MTFLYKSRWGNNPDMTKCRAHVSTNGSFYGHQCTNKGIIDRDGVLFCRTHDPVAVEEKRAKRNEKWEAQWKEKNERWAAEEKQRDLLKRSLDAIRAIAAGHNDPRSLAVEVLSQEVQADE